MSIMQKEVDERTNLTASNKFELLLFRLGTAPHSEQRELFGINVFKVREIMVMPTVTAVTNASPHLMGVTNIRGQVIPVIDLSAAVGCSPGKGLGILLVTEYARTTQAFAVEEVDEIVRLDWNQVLSAEDNTAAGGMITSIARLDGDVHNTRLAQVLDVEQILRKVRPPADEDMTPGTIGDLNLPAGTMVLVADDSGTARSLIEQCLSSLHAPVIMTKSGQEAWDMLDKLARKAQAEGKPMSSKISLVLTDLEMPEMDGFTLTRRIKQDRRFAGIPVIIHSSLTGTTNESHVKSVGADAYVAKFVASELADAIRKVMKR